MYRFLLIQDRFFDVCPSTDPTLIGLNVVIDFGIKASMPWTNCGSYLENIDCLGGLGYEAPLSTGEVYNPTNTPSAGTQTLSDISGQMTTPASGATFTWFGYASSHTYPVIALSADTTAATTLGVESSTTTGGIGTKATTGVTAVSGITDAGSGSPTSNPTSPATTSKSSGQILQFSNLLLAGSSVVLGIPLFL